MTKASFRCATVLFMCNAAVRQRSYDVVLCLIMGGAFVEQVCLRKWTAMHEAAKVGGRCQEVAVTRNCGHGTPSNKSCLSHPPPKKEGCPAILTLLLRHGAKVTSTDGHGVTPMGIAAEYGNAEALEILIQHGGPL